jgi:hypothetical protein
LKSEINRYADANRRLRRRVKRLESDLSEALRKIDSISITQAVDPLESKDGGLQ